MMQGSYDLTLVFASYCVAVIASYTALYFGTKLFEVSGATRRYWLAIGALCMGSGIWSMHFVGMSAYTMPMGMQMSFSLPLTFVSWLPAIAASALALYIIARERVSVAGLVGSALVMGAGICAMHYTGMAAMRMSPGIQYDPVWFTISVLIAIGASGAALVICRQVRRIPVRAAVWVKLGAALVMGVAICGMHYTGMIAAGYAPDASMPASNLLRGSWMGIPAAVVTAVALLLALWFAVVDFRYLEKLRRAEKEREAWVDKATWNDAATGFHNRQGFDTLLAEHIAKTDPRDGFVLIGLQLTGYRNLVMARDEDAGNLLAKHAAKGIAQCVPDGCVLARPSRAGFIVLASRVTQRELDDMVVSLATTMQTAPYADEQRRWTLGYSQYPGSARDAKTLVEEANRPRYVNGVAKDSVAAPA